MDIGTAKPSIEARKKIPHHLIDIVDPTHDYSVSEFLQESHAQVAKIQSLGKNVLLVGGTPLYLKSLICGFFQGPPADWDFRKAVDEEVQSVGLQALAERLKQVDPLSAHRILPGDQRRMVRALEVAKLTGKPLSHWQTQFERFVVPAPLGLVPLGLVPLGLVPLGLALVLNRASRPAQPAPRTVGPPQLEASAGVHWPRAGLAAGIGTGPRVTSL
jgi:hypothetical protein